jgi:hypothetical protein
MIQMMNQNIDTKVLSNWPNKSQRVTLHCVVFKGQSLAYGTYPTFWLLCIACFEMKQRHHNNQVEWLYAEIENLTVFRSAAVLRCGCRPRCHVGVVQVSSQVSCMCHPSRCPGVDHVLDAMQVSPRCHSRPRCCPSCRSCVRCCPRCHTGVVPGVIQVLS